MFTEQKKIAEDAGVITTHHRVDDAQLDQIVPTWKCIDGMHRTTALQELLAECEKEEDKARYEWANACIYAPGVKPKICALAKAINSQGEKFVPEDNLERITFMQKMIQSWATETRMMQAEEHGDREGFNQYLQDGALWEEAEKVTFFFLMSSEGSTSICLCTPVRKVVSLGNFYEKIMLEYLFLVMTDDESSRCISGLGQVVFGANGLETYRQGKGNGLRSTAGDGGCLYHGVGK